MCLILTVSDQLQHSLCQFASQPLRSILLLAMPPKEVFTKERLNGIGARAAEATLQTPRLT